MGRASVVAVVVAVGLVSSALADGVMTMPIPEVVSTRKLDTESTVFAAITNGVAGQHGFGFDISFGATASNNVEVALGEDRDGDGRLSFSETEVVAGWDCGRYFVEPLRIGKRYFSQPYPEPKSRRMKYNAVTDGLVGGLESFRIDVDEGVLGPTGVVDAASVAGDLWADTYVDTAGRHRIHFQVVRSQGSSWSKWTYMDTPQFTGSLSVAAPSFMPAGCRLLDDALGLRRRCMVHGSGAVYVAASETRFEVGGRGDGSGIGGLYFDVTGVGTVRFTVSESYNYGGYQWVVSVDDVRVASGDGGYGASGGWQPKYETVEVSIGGASALTAWVWRPRWNMMRVTKRGRASSPSGAFTVRQRGSFMQIR